MTGSLRDREKLMAIGYFVQLDGESDEFGNATYEWGLSDTIRGDAGSEDQGWAEAAHHAKSPHGMKETMADKVRFMGADLRSDVYGKTGHSRNWEVALDFMLEVADSPEAAVDAMFWRMP